MILQVNQVLLEVFVVFIQNFNLISRICQLVRNVEQCHTIVKFGLFIGCKNIKPALGGDV